MNSKKEIYEALLRGEKLTNQRYYNVREYITMRSDGNMYSNYDEPVDFAFDPVAEWHIWQPPKKKAWINLYRNSPRNWSGVEYSTKEEADASATRDRIKCIEVEVDE